MRYGRMLLVVSIVGLLCAPVAARADDIAELQAAFAQIVAAYGARDLETLTAGLHDNMTLFGVISPFPVDGKPAVRQYFERIFTSNERTAIELIQPQYWVSGTTGIVRSNVALTGKPQDGPATIVFGRMTWTFLKTDGQWRAVAAHVSRVPSGN